MHILSRQSIAVANGSMQHLFLVQWEREEHSCRSPLLNSENEEKDEEKWWHGE